LEIIRSLPRESAVTIFTGGHCFEKCGAELVSQRSQQAPIFIRIAATCATTFAQALRTLLHLEDAA
jgi:hypothetical protein